MKHILSAIAFLILAWPGISLGEWYSLNGAPTTTIRFRERGKFIELSVRKLDLRVTALVLRRDTENGKTYWVEATLPEQRDSGDGYLLAIGDVMMVQIYTRGKKWAIGFTTLEQARRCFEHLRKLHRLDSDHAQDATKA